MSKQNNVMEPIGLSANEWQFLGRPDAYVAASNGKLDPNSTPRQLMTAQDIVQRMNGSDSQAMRRGILLADDVGLGKTTVAVLVAWIIASAGSTGRVKILVPNDVMRRKWVEELRFHVPMLNVCAPHLFAKVSRVKDGKVPQLRAGCINVLNHSYAGQKSNLNCDLLIIDEAHRAKGEGSAFAKELKRQKRFAKRILILTATPFSIKLEELQRMLVLIGADGANVQSSVKSYSRALDDLYSEKTSRNAEVVAKRLVKKATDAIDALSAYVIRHGVDDLPLEKAAFGERTEWPIRVEVASPSELELLVRMNRALRLAKSGGLSRTKSSHDPRFDVGWQHLDSERKSLKVEAHTLKEPEGQVVKHHLQAIGKLRIQVGVHPKMIAVARTVVETVATGEKVLLFCHHHATAQELSIRLDAEIPKLADYGRLRRDAWITAWTELLEDRAFHENHHPTLLKVFVEWLCADLIRSQTHGWFKVPPSSIAKLKDALLVTKGRSVLGSETVFNAACRLYDAMLRSNSARAVLKRAEGAKEEQLLPGSNGTSRVLGVCESIGDSRFNRLFIHNTQPDTVIAIFNSPFGPDVLVATDKLSEGVDLHRYCRHLIHYELDPSPIRTVQRNGRLRRVECWAAVTKQPIMFAYPAFAGTRDQKLAQIMKKRISSFSLLLGGVQDIDLEEVLGEDEDWRSRVIELAKGSLSKLNGKLAAKIAS